MSYKLKFFIAEVLQCLVDKYRKTYQNILVESVARPHLVESSYCKTLGPLKGAHLTPFFAQKTFLVIVAM